MTVKHYKAQQQQQQPPAFFVCLLLVSLLSTLSVAHNCYQVTKYGLKIADCNNKDLESIPEDLERDVKVLFFSDNKLDHLAADAFRNYAGLQEANLIRNKMKTIAPGAFRYTTNLQKLDLEGNALTAVPTQALEPLGNSLRFLSMKSNPIGRLPFNALRPLKNLVELDLENCHLESIDPKALKPLEHLTHLNLVNNDLRVLDAEMVRYMPPSLKVLRLHENPWHCDCRLRWLRLWVQQPGSEINWDFIDNTPTCETPLLKTRIQWKHLTPDQFACPSHIETNNQTSNTEMRAGTGGNVTFECYVYGDPQPIIRWMKGSYPVSMTNGGQNVHVNSVNQTDVKTGETIIKTTLSLHNAHLENIGDYRCLAENPAGRSEVMFKLWVEARREQPPDEVTPAQTVTAQGDSFLSKEILIGVVTGTGIIILMLVCTVIVMARKCLRQGVQQRRDKQRRQKQPEDGSQRSTVQYRNSNDAAHSKRAEKAGSGNSSLAHNTSGEFSMRNFKDYNTIAADKHTSENETNSKTALVDVASNETTTKISHLPARGAGHSKDIRHSEKHDPTEMEQLIKKKDPVDLPTTQLGVGESSANVPLKVNGSPVKYATIARHSSHTSPPQKPERRLQQLENVKRDATNSVSDERKHDDRKINNKSQTLPLRPRVTESFESDSAITYGAGTKTMRPPTRQRERSPCQNPVCLKGHIRASLQAGSAGSSATLGPTVRKSNLAKQGNGNLKASLSVGNLAAETSTDAQMIEMITNDAKMSANAIKQHVAARADVAAGLKTHPQQMTTTPGNTQRPKEPAATVILHNRKPEKDVVGTVSSPAKTGLVATPAIGLIAIPAKSTNIMQDAPHLASTSVHNNTTAQTIITTRSGANFTPSGTPQKTATVGHSSPQHNNSKLQLSINATVSLQQTTTTNERLHHEQSPVVVYPRPGERDEYGTAV